MTPKEGSRKNTLTEIGKNATDDATNDIEEVDDDTDDNIKDSSKHNRENTHPRTTELELAKNATTILRAASKRKGRCSLGCSENIKNHIFYKPDSNYGALIYMEKESEEKNSNF